MKTTLPFVLTCVLATVSTLASAQTLTYTSGTTAIGFVPPNLLTTATLAAQSGSFGQEGTGPLSVLTDGSPGAKNSPGAWDAIGNGASLTYNLDTTSNPLGYTINGIDLVSGWGDFGRGNIQNVTVSYELVGGSTFTTLLDGSTIVNQNLAGGGSGVFEDVNYSNGGDPLVNNVAAVKFDFGAQQNGYVGYRELDIEGAPSTSGGGGAVPEPSTYTLILLGGSLLAFRQMRLVRR